MSSPMKLEKKTGHKLPMGALDVSLSPDGQSIAVACMDGVYRQSIADGNYAKLYDHRSYVSSVHWLRDDLIVSAGYDGAVRWFDPTKSHALREVELHDFWSWDMAVSADGSVIASVTGQYLAGGYKYEPQPESEPSLCLLSVESGKVLHELPHVPSVQAVAISPDGRHVAAGNLMGEVRVFDIETGTLKASWTTPDFTSWGIIKSHCYLGGIFAIEFTPDGEHVLLAGMGKMRDPMAGNGKQLWQKWRWTDSSSKEAADSEKVGPTKVDQTHDRESGEGLMETLAIHPGGQHFVMGGRLRGGDWNVAAFGLDDGKRVATLKTGYRVTEAAFDPQGDRLFLVGAQGQPKKNKEGKISPFGRFEVYEVESS